MEALLGPRKTEWVGRPCKIVGKVQARIIELACEEPPDEHARWTVRLLQKNIKKKGIVDKTSVITVQRVLKKNEFQPHRSAYWKISGGQGRKFLAKMEDVLDVYARPYDPTQPVVCMDEPPK